GLNRCNGILPRPPRHSGVCRDPPRGRSRIRCFLCKTQKVVAEV
ncbi:MAG: hypothetical protein EB023_15315, partial [Flavobacteriia bacterium]|nr:hypothetical protein [Flavobacteriia bacterium]